ncbi:uncharacterized protein L3040_009200 [Drepanopeziza brunnea f. sp. 'multigermtubi']|uniref:uncharacterized protein n=1 Tax=Drepanopeziza brunnea f. sp. 'multigermtubi' TaxID=698441 RepID=UPI0023953ECF|nr:hypothetical protein L3040_009200 [Drepanopeziza brunnea f. sp. 'multigermtubi']
MPDDREERLEPPAKSIDDPGAHDLESSEESEDHFSDAQSGLDPLESPTADGAASPIPHTRVEKVDDEASYGEEPGTEAYRLREQDAAPDEIAVIPDARSPDFNAPDSKPSSPLTPTGGHPIPLMIVEKIDPETPSHGEVPGTLAHDLRAADAVPDLISGQQHPWRPSDPLDQGRENRLQPSPRRSPRNQGIRATERGRRAGHRGGSRGRRSRSPIINHARRKSSAAGKKGAPASAAADAAAEYDEAEDGSDGGFGDDFDDFEEGEEDAEFGDFGDDFQEAAPAPPPPQSIPVTPSFPVLDFADLDSPEEVQAATESYMNALFPADSIDASVLPPVTAEHPIFLTPRSASLWSQLVAPPPLQPPNWIRSRIRRLFLVSLGVPVDLDEILPASKQKKLILPSMNLNPASGSPRTSSDSRSISRLKQSDGNASSTSVDSQGKPSRSDSKRRRGPPPAPQLDLISARQLCSFTDEALDGLTAEELKAHVAKLEEMQGTAKEVLEYWKKRTDEKIGDREAFEGVIENLVKHARKVRK